MAYNKDKGFPPKVALKSFVAWVEHEGVQRVMHMRRGDIITDPNDPRYKGREVLFGEVEGKPLPASVDMSAPVVESATAAPGEVRASVNVAGDGGASQGA